MITAFEWEQSRPQSYLGLNANSFTSCEIEQIPLIESQFLPLQSENGYTLIQKVMRIRHQCSNQESQFHADSTQIQSFA